MLREDLEPWQRLNVASFAVSGVAAAPGVYLPMFHEPVLIFGALADEMKRTSGRAHAREVAFSVFTEQLFNTFNDADNRTAVAAVATDDLATVGIAFRCQRKTADKILKGLKLLR
ncbi:DUF2000 domain-containing protein [Caballeronia grimmiae]|uniref:DUF2000 domain-containing protein n=1 Tax=Caballeronia grimmiae TaxID=1071679 RepID=UPI0006914C01|nr:DUF2000 domain-containing protein [Caballeronia grimmiae]